MDRATKLDRLDAFLAERELAEVWFARPNSFAWLTGGDNVVDRAGDIGVAAAGYDGDSVRIVTNDIEAERLRAEEVSDPVHPFVWHESSLEAVVAEQSKLPAAADFDVPGFEAVDASALRQPLTEADVETYRDLGADVADALQATCREAVATDTELDVAADLRQRLMREGIDSPVALVGSGERAPRYRHYTPQDVALGDYALVSVTATRDGLCASCTRTVVFDEPDWLRERHDAAATVEATALAATRKVGREGGTAGDVFAAIQRAYESVGYPGEWRNHHQGGAAGFAGREWIATPDSEDPVLLPQAYAWNPTVQGAKSEDTVLVTEDGLEVLTRPDDWPTASYEPVGHEGLPTRAIPLRR
ncbi:M24 family metallopeptidase [Haloarchaeobius amylolyticus]|uniref:M24 family metallopeptidase n=1 Tax=Haloarchaeobius amylolyticus TaxID=1198296 RepID=UPI0022720889|nr:M24 family metallopeptidase [Haloarchaeobius amylolyticus]